MEDYLETNFNTICEDGSPDELGELLVMMWRQCIVGDFTLVTNSLAREFVRHESLAQCKGISATGDAMDSDDDEDVEEGADLDTIAEEEDGETMEVLPPPPRVDPDGWETVARGKSRSRKTDSV